jgi:hypothetical protein
MRHINISVDIAIVVRQALPALCAGSRLTD